MERPPSPAGSFTTGAPSQPRSHARSRGDDFIPDAGARSTIAMTIDAPPSEVWPWLVQMGCNRAGWYSYDFIDNGGVASATRLLPEFQDIAVGSVIPADPRATVGFPILLVDPRRALVLRQGGRHAPAPLHRVSRHSRPLVWSFVLDEPVDRPTRLLVRNRHRASAPPGAHARAAVGRRPCPHAAQAAAVDQEAGGGSSRSTAGDHAAGSLFTGRWMRPPLTTG